jgi:uncharacterized membrane protein (DUF2068 family)
MPIARRAPTLWAIITIKLLRGAVLISLAVGAYNLVGQDLRPHFENAVRLVKLDPETDFFVRLGDRLDAVKPSAVAWVATGALLYGILSLAEGIGLIFRVRAVGWLVLAESAFFIPVECNALMHKFTTMIFIILLVNVLIVIYLWRNRERLFKH